MEGESVISKLYKGIFKIVAITILIFTLQGYNTNALSNRDNLKEELNKQEETLEEEMKPIDPLEGDKVQSLYEKALDDLQDNIKNTTGVPDFKSKSAALQRLVFKLVINSRTIAIYSYIGVWVIGILYASTFGSRDVNKRRKTYLIIRNVTVLFLVYINIPLFIIWLNADKSNISSMSAFNVVYDCLEFLQKNSLIIAALMLYAGLSRVIISRNDLPLRKQGKYLIKFSGITLILLNIAPVAMYFLV